MTAFVASLVMIACTRWGVGLSPDSTVYIGTARNLLEGHGLSLPSGNDPFAPLAHWPPLLSVVLTLPGLIGVDPLETARWLQVVLFGANTFLVGVVIRAYSASTGMAVLAACLFISWEVSLEVHSWAWSEPLFIFLVLLGFCLLSAHFSRVDSRFLVPAGVMVGLAFLTRYIGITVVIAAAAAILTFDRPERRVRSLFTLATLAVLPMAIWHVHLMLSGTMSRSPGFHPPALGLTDTFQLLLPAGLALGLAAASRGLPPGPGSNWARQIPPILVRFVVIYVLLFPLPLIFLDASTPVDTRLLSPTYIALLILVVCFMSDLRPWIRQHQLRRNAALTAAGALLVVHLVEAVPLVLDRLEDGAGYASRRWRESETMAQLRDLKSEPVIYSNAPDAIFLLAARPAFSLPTRVDLVSGEKQSAMDHDLRVFVEKLDADAGLVAWFYGVDRFFLPSREEVVRTLDRDPIREFSDGAIYEGRPRGRE